jgi:integrase/recombinase XerC
VLPRNPPAAPARPLTAAEHELRAALRQGYIDHRLAAGHRPSSIAVSCRLIDAFGAYTGLPEWHWSADAFNRYCAELLNLGNAALTIRSKQLAVKGYLAFATDEAYGHNERCAQLGVRIRQIVRRSNSLPHQRKAERGVRRHLTDPELTTLFASNLAEVMKPRPRAIEHLAAQLRYALPAIGLCFATRANELVQADYPRDVPSATGPTKVFSPVAGLEIWHGKAYRGGPARGRFVPAIALFANALAILDWYLTDVRPQLVRPHSPPALLLTTTGDRFDSHTLSLYFRKMADAAGLPAELTFHCLRHTFATTLYRHGFEIDVIRMLLGHELQSTTMIYIHAETPFMQQRLLEHNARLQREHTASREHGDERT